MSVPANLGEKQELHDKEVQALFGGTNGAATGPAAQETTEEKCSRLSEECERLRTELAEVRKERDEHLKCLYAMLRRDPEFSKIPEFTREEVFACIGQRPTLEELIRELEESWGMEHA